MDYPNATKAYVGQAIGSGLGSTQCEVAEISGVERGFRRVQNSFDVAESKLKLLFDRLTPILRVIPPSPTQPGNKATEGGQSQITEQLHQFASRGEMLASGLEEILMRLEL